MLPKHAIFIIVYSLITINIYSQNSVVAKSFVKDKTVYLRFLCNNSASFKKCLDKGYEIKKIAWNSSSIPDTLAFKNALEITVIKSADKASFEWEIMRDKYEEADFLYNYLFQTSTAKSANPEMLYGIAMLSCDFNIDLAKACGLYFKDDKPFENTCAYLIWPVDAQLKKTIAPAILITNVSVNDELKNIDTVKIKTHRKEVKLYWNEKILKSYYAGYHIERSEDGNNFIQINTKPVIQVTSQYEKDKTDIFYNDTATQYGKTYYYRVRGLNHFGVYGSYSPIVKCYLAKPMDDFPVIENVVVVKDSSLQVIWSMPKAFDTKELKGFNLYRSEKSNEGFVKINKTIIALNEKTFVDNTARPSNYYMIVAYNNYGDSAASHPFLGMVPDKFPPKTPVGLNGKVDTTGIVKLHWKANKESDLLGYRIFRNNAMNEEMIEVTTRILTDTTFTDTITLQTLTEEVYYTITAVDKVYNNSKQAMPVKLKRPDKIAPAEAQIKSIIHNDTAIIINWIASTGKDVIKYELYRKTEGFDFQKINEWNANKADTLLLDTQLEYATYYTYQIKTIDDDGNFSFSREIIHYYDSRIRKPIQNIKYETLVDKRIIILKWQYPEKQLYNFVIYKAKAGEVAKIVKTLKPEQTYFEDKQIELGNKYVYQIKANFISGAESYLSKEIIVEY